MSQAQTETQTQTQPRTQANRDATGTTTERADQHYDVVVIGGGQAGMAVGYYLKKRGLRFVILEANPRVGDVWRQRWDSLRLFTPAKFDGLVGMRFPAPANSFPTKDEMADYLETYAARFSLPVRTGARVQRLSRWGNGYRVETSDQTIEADQVVVAMASYQSPPDPQVRARAARRHRAAALEGVQKPRAAARRRRADRRRRQLGRGDRGRPGGQASGLDVGARRRAHPLPHRRARLAGCCWRAWCYGSPFTAC